MSDSTYKKEYYNRISANDIESLKLLNIQIEAIYIGIYAYILLYISTVEGINLIYSKYDINIINDNFKNDRNSSSSLEPDFIAVQSTYMFFIARLMFVYVSFTRYDIIFNKSIIGEFEFSLQPNIYINTANALGLLAALYSILGAEGIYARDNTQAVFG